MYRSNKLVIRLNKAEWNAINRLARAERLPTSTFARWLLLKEVDARGLWLSLESQETGNRRKEEMQRS